jgi:hypothetical protein
MLDSSTDLARTVDPRRDRVERLLTLGTVFLL